INRIPEAQRKGLLEFVNSLDGCIEPLEDLAATIRAVLKLFYPTERAASSDANVDELAYYYQREWRIIDGVTIFDVPGDGPLSKGEKKALLDLDGDFFKEPTRYGDSHGPRVDLCRIIRSVGNKPVKDLIHHITVPADFREDAHTIASDCGFSGEVRILRPQV